MYWENPPGCSRPAYLDLCLETIRRHLGSFELKLLDEHSVTDYIELPKAIFHPALPLAYKSNYIRFALLYEYGGVWLDSDTILLREVDEFASDGLAQTGFVIFARNKEGVGFQCYTGALASVRRSVIVKQALAAMRRELSYASFRGLRVRCKYLIKKHLLRVSPAPHLWLTNSLAILARILPQHAHHAHPIRRSGLPWAKHAMYYRDIDDLTPYLRNNPLLFNLYHSGGMGKALHDRTREQLLSGQSLLARAFRLALR